MRGIVIAFLLLFSLSAQGQFIIDSYRFGAPAGLLLDSFPNAAAAYSLRLLRTGYTGDAIVVRRSSNNDTLSIGFSGGVFDTVALKNFCGTGATDTCFVRRLFDQSGNGRNFVQTTSANQPRVLTSGVVNRDNGQPSIIFDGTNDWMDVPSSTAMFNYLHDGTTSTIFGVARFGRTGDTLGEYSFYDNMNTDANFRGACLFYVDTLQGERKFLRGRVSAGSSVINAQMNANDIITPFALQLIYSRIDADNATAADRLEIAVNAGTAVKLNINTGAVSGSNAGYNMTIGASANTRVRPLRGALNELIFYNADQSTNRTAIETNINNFYQIY